MIIDAHGHLHGSDLHPAVVGECERLGIDRILLSAIAHFQHHPSFDHVRQANDDLTAVIQAYPDLVSGYCYLNPRHGTDALDELRRRVEDDGMIGIKLWVATTADDPLVDPIVEQAIAYDIPILMHAWRKTVGQLPYESKADNIARIAARYPEVKIIMAHLGGQAESAMNTIAPYPNVLTDPSGTIIGGGEVAIAVNRLGVDRVVFGSDLSGGCLAANIGKIIAADLSDEDTAKVLGGTMESLLAGGGAR